MSRLSIGGAYLFGKSPTDFFQRRHTPDRQLPHFGTKEEGFGQDLRKQDLRQG